MLIRKFFANISLLISLNIIVKAFWVLGIDRTVQNVVGAGEYGLYFSLFSFSVIFNILLDFGITSYNNRRISGTPSALAELMGNVFLIRGGFAIIYAMVTLTAAFLVGYDQRRFHLLLVLMGNQFLVSFILYLRSNITALQLFRADSVISVTDRFLMIIICGFLLWGGSMERGFSIELFIYAQTLAYSLTFIVALVTILKTGRIIKLKVDFAGVKRIVRESAPYALLSLFITVYWRIDSVMIERLLPGGLAEAGVYAQAFRLFDAAAMVPFLFSVILLPMVSGMYSRGESLSQLLRFSSFLVLVPAAAATVVALTWPKEVMELLYLEHIEESSKVLMIIMAGYIPVSLVYIHGTFLTATGRLRRLNYMALGAMVSNIILNFVLIPTMGISGGAVASVITQFMLAGAYIYTVVKEDVAGNTGRYLFIFAIYIAILALAAWILRITAAGLFTGTLIAVGVAVTVPLAAGVFSRDNNEVQGPPGQR